MQWCEGDPAELNSILDAVLDRAEIGIWFRRVNENRTTVDERLMRIIGLDTKGPSELGPEDWWKLVHPDDLETARRSMEAFISGATDRYEVALRLLHAKGRFVWVQASGVVVERDPEDRPVLVAGAYRDISEQILNEERLLDLSIRDPLTGIFNRRRVLERLRELIARCERGGSPIAVVLFDIDHFKAVNDAYGHQAGDQVIKDFAATLQAGVREYDVVGRYGGEEFLAILDGSDSATAAAVVDRILAAVRTWVTVHGEAGIRFTASAGVACSDEFDQKFLSETNLLGLADARLYCAKESGRDRAVGVGPIDGGCESE